LALHTFFSPHSSHDSSNAMIARIVETVPRLSRCRRALLRLPTVNPARPDKACRWPDARRRSQVCIKGNGIFSAFRGWLMR
jgi:hypothetical protein